MMSLPRIFGLMLLFFFFEAVVAVVTVFFFPDTSVILACAAMTGLALVTWMFIFLLTRMLSKPRETKAPVQQKAFVPAVQKVSSGDDSFTLEFTAMVAEANRRLQTLTSVDGQRQAPTVAALPLYLILGAEGSGKTTAILNSGIEPRLLAGEAQKDGMVLPTSLANLWYAEGAIFAEISGRVLMQEPDRFEKAMRILGQQREIPRWRRLLHGDTTPTNLSGVLLVCDTEMLLQSKDVNRLGTVARTLNERLQTVQSLMRVDFPTYVLLTRCDGISYFQEFFAQLSDAESRRILGVSLPVAESSNTYANVYADREGSRLTKFFNRLCQSVADKRMILLAREETVEKRALAYEFPRELKKLRGELVQLLLDTFRPSTLHPPIRLRGFYFSGRRLVPRTNSTTETTSIDHSVIKRPTEATVFFRSPSRSSTQEYSTFGRSPVDTMISKWTFLTDVFRDVILTDPAGKVALVSTRAADSKYVKIALGVVGSVFLLLSVIWVFSWQVNHSLLNKVEKAVKDTRISTTANVAETLSELELLRPLMVTLHGFERDHKPLVYRWGLYSGDRASSDLDSLYYTRFRQAILDPTVYAMSGHFMGLQANDPVSEDIYKELKAYRTITSGFCKPDDLLVAPMMLQVWSSIASRDQDMDALADKQIAFYSNELKITDPYRKAIPEDGDAVLKAQSYLLNLTGPDKILQALLIQVSQQQLAERLSGYASNYSQVLIGPDQMDSPYTRAGWKVVQDSIRDHKLASAGEPCVVGSNSVVSGWAGDAAMDAQVQKQYSKTYSDNWKQFLGAHHVIPFTNPTDAAQKLRTLAANNRSPLLALIYMTSTNTDVTAAQTMRDRASDTLHAAADATTKTVQTVMTKMGVGAQSALPKPAPASSATDGDITVRTAFNPVHAMVDPSSRDKWLNEKNQAYMTALGGLSDAFQLLPGQVHADVAPEMQALQQARTAITTADAALHALEANFPNTPTGIDVDLESLLREPIDLSRRTISSVVTIKAAPVGPGGPTTAPPPAADPKVALQIKATIKQVNVSAIGVCSASSSLQTKFPFDATSSTEASISDLNQLLQPGTGVYSQFAASPDVSKVYTHVGRIWAAQPGFPATYSQPFLFTLNNLGEIEDELYGDGSANPHFNLTLTVDGTGKIPFELDVDGHKIKFTPGKPIPPPLQLVWPPITNSPTHLILKNGVKGSVTSDVPWTGPWGLFHLLQAADSQTGNVFTFNRLEFAHSLIPLKNEKGVQGTIQITVTSAASNIFSRGYFAKMRCNDTWALQWQNPATNAGNQ